MRTTTPSTETSSLRSRPARQALGEIFVLSLFATFLAGMIGVAADPQNDILQALNRMPSVGMAALDHIGWAFGVYVPVLLSFYVIVIGRELTDSGPAAGRTRRNLGLAAEAMMACFTPALAVVVAACVSQPSHAGALLVIVPVTAVMLFLAVRLGGVIVPDREQRLAAARRSVMWAEERLPHLKVRSARPLRLILVVNIILSTIISVSVSTLAASEPGVIRTLQLLVLYAFISLLFTALNVNAIYSWHSAGDRASKILAWALPLTIYLVVTLLIVLAFICVPPAGYGVGTIALLIGLSSFWPRKYAPHLLVNWSLQGAGARCAAKSIATTYVRSLREIRELSATQETSVPSTLRDRIIAAVKALSGRSNTGP